MSTSTRKAREVQARERLILRTAEAMVAERGYLGMNMDRIAEATEYSKGTIYQHFANKEEIVAALCVEGGERRVELFRRAASFDGRPRERMTAIGVSTELYLLLHPGHVQMEQLFHTESIREKTPESRLQLLFATELGCMDAVVGIVRDAVTEGDLTLPDDVAPEDVCFGLWSLTYGGQSLIAAKPHLGEVGIAEAAAALRRNQHALMDGYAWGPASHAWDYDATRRRILAETFPEEAAATGLV
ncbi:MAG: helix-turn-helix domain-containing protein [Planctomycetota bacterium]|nr:helix-turn-helix domain-containing protein [Planctomycetota bacterium]